MRLAKPSEVVPAFRGQVCVQPRANPVRRTQVLDWEGRNTDCLFNRHAECFSFRTTHFAACVGYATLRGTKRWSAVSRHRVRAGWPRSRSHAAWRARAACGPHAASADATRWLRPCRRMRFRRWRSSRAAPRRRGGSPRLPAACSRRA